MKNKKCAEDAMNILKMLDGLGKNFIALSESDKKAIARMPEAKGVINRGVAEALSREITIAFSHNKNFRPPPCAIVLLSCKGKIVGEMTDSGKKFYFQGSKTLKSSHLRSKLSNSSSWKRLENSKNFHDNGAKESDSCILPPVPFPELDGAFSNVCSASPGYEADAFLRTRIKVEKGDATLLVGFDVKR